QEHVEAFLQPGLLHRGLVAKGAEGTLLGAWRDSGYQQPTENNKCNDALVHGAVSLKLKSAASRGNVPCLRGKPVCLIEDYRRLPARSRLESERADQGFPACAMQ